MDLKPASLRSGATRLARQPRGRAALPSGGQAWLGVVVTLVFSANLIFSRSLWGDAFYDLYAGRYITQHGIPRRNVVTVASHGAPWIDQQWLAHLAFYGAWAAGGYPALVALSCVLVTSAFGVLAVIMLRRGVVPTRACAWTLAAFLVCVGNTQVRAQSFGYLFMALTLWLIVEDSRRPRLQWRGWPMIAILVLWANTYGSVLLGAGLVGLYAGYRIIPALGHRDGPDRRDRRAVAGYTGLGALAAISVLCCPYGIGVIGYYERFGGPVVRRYDPQWAPPSLHNPLCWIFFVLAAATAIVMAIAWRRGTRPDPVLGGLAAALLIAALTTYKDIAWFGLAGSLLAADTLTRAGLARQSATRARLGISAAAIGTGLALASLALVVATSTSEFEAQMPWRAINVAASVTHEHPGWRVLSDAWSSTAMVWLQPSTLGKVAVDMRLEQYSAAEFSSFEAFLLVSGPHWQDEATGYNVIVCAPARNGALAAAITRAPGWRVVYADRDGIVLVRTSSSAGEG